MGNVATINNPETTKAKPKLARQFVSFAFYQISPKWRLLSKEAKEKDKKELANLIEQFQKDKKCQVLTYTTVGTKADADFLLWVIAYELEPLQELVTAINQSSMGAYLKRSHSFLAMTKRSMYLDRLDPEHQEDRQHILPGKYKYFFVYPFVKKRDWYLLSMEKR